MNFKAVTRNRTNKEGKTNVNIRISHARKVRYISTDIQLFPSQFDNDLGFVKQKEHPNARELNYELKKIIYEYEVIALRLTGSTDIKNLLALLKGNTEKSNRDFFAETENYINQLANSNRLKSKEMYQYMLNSLRQFHKSAILEFKGIDIDFLNRYENHLKKNRLGINSIGVHMRAIRSIYNRGIDSNLVGLEHYPFRRFKIKKQRTDKRSLTIEQMKKIKSIHLDGKEAYIRDVFLLIFYLIGINLIDLFYLQEIKSGRIIYNRRKTGRLYNIKVLPEALELINKYKGERYLLNFDKYYKNHDGLKKGIIKYMKKVAAKCEIDEHITSYYARHSWATIASKLGVSKDVIAHALGHGNDTVTDVYIDFDLAAVDKANELVCKAV